MASLRVAGFEDVLASACAGPGGLSFEERVAGAAAFADLGCDAALAEGAAEWVAAVAAVGPDLFGLVAGVAECVDEWEQVRALVLVPGAEPDLERPAVRLDCEVVFAGWEAAVDRAGPDQVAPFFASTSEASTTTRDQSSLCAFSSSLTRSASTCGQTPRSIHSCKRRRQVSPLGKPSSRGRST